MKPITMTLLTLAGAVCMETSAQQAMCVFRSPDRDVFSLFPEATNYTSVFGKIDRSNRKALEKKLGHRIGINDIGIHTLYVILKKDAPIGFIHARGEWGTYGNIEIIWAFNLDGSIRDYRIQRSREKGTALIQESGFREQFAGLKLGDPITNGEKAMNTELLQPIAQHIKISSIMAYSAKKTLILNKYVFGNAITERQELASK